MNYTVNDAVNILYRCGFETVQDLLNLLRKGGFEVGESFRKESANFKIRSCVMVEKFT